MLNLNNKTFTAVENSDTGEVSGKTLFSYFQEGSRVWADYFGGEILRGHLIALMDEEGCLDMKYHHINIHNELKSGVCRSVPEILSDGRIRFHEQWTWSNGITGSSVIEEVLNEP